MQLITLIVGLPGSGKTYLGEQLASERENTIFVDDVCLDFMFEELKYHSKRDVNLIISDPYFCIPETLKKFQNTILKELFNEVETEIIYFESNLRKCLGNIVYRHYYHNDDRSVKELLRPLSKRYVIPEGVKTMPIWQPKPEDLENYFNDY